MLFWGLLRLCIDKNEPTFPADALFTPFCDELLLLLLMLMLIL